MARPRVYDEARVSTAIRLPASLHGQLQRAAVERDVSVNAPRHQGRPGPAGTAPVRNRLPTRLGLAAPGPTGEVGGGTRSGRPPAPPGSGPRAGRATTRRRSTSGSSPRAFDRHAINRRPRSTSSTGTTPGTWTRSSRTRWRWSSRPRPTSPARSTRRASASNGVPGTYFEYLGLAATTSSPSASGCSSPAVASPSTSPTSAGALPLAVRRRHRDPAGPRAPAAGRGGLAEGPGRRRVVRVGHVPAAGATRCCATSPSGS